MLNPPFSILAEQAGLRSLGLAVKLIGPYQGGGAVVLRSWAKGNADTESLRLAVAPANRTEAAALLAERLKLPPDVALKAYDLAADPVGGFARDAKFDLDPHDPRPLRAAHRVAGPRSTAVASGVRRRHRPR